MSYSSIVLDLDGTLVDSEAVAFAALRVACDEAHGDYERSAQFLRKMQGEPLEVIFAAAELPQTAIATFREASLGQTDLVRPFPGVIELCAEFHDRGIQLAIVTGKEERRTFAILNSLGIRDLFDPIIACDSGFAPKPSPEPILAVVAAHGAPLDRAVYIGDSDADAESARRAGVRFCRCLWGQATNGLSSASMESGFNTIAELREILLAANSEGRDS